MGGVTDVWSAERLFRKASDCEHASALGKALDEPQPVGDLGGAWTAVGKRRAGAVGVGRHEVPEQDVVGDPELCERSVHDRRADLGRPGTGQLPLGREREPGNARSAIARCLTDQQQRSIAAGGEVVVETAPPQC